MEEAIRCSEAGVVFAAWLRGRKGGLALVAQKAVWLRLLGLFSLRDLNVPSRENHMLQVAHTGRANFPPP